MFIDVQAHEILTAKWRLTGPRLDRAPKDKCSLKVRPRSTTPFVFHPPPFAFHLQTTSLFEADVRFYRTRDISTSGKLPFSLRIMPMAEKFLRLEIAYQPFEGLDVGPRVKASWNSSGQYL